MAVKSTHADQERLITVASAEDEARAIYLASRKKAFEKKQRERRRALKDPPTLSPYDSPRKLLKSTVTEEGVPLFAEDSPSAATNLMDAALLKIDLMEKGTPDPKKYKYSAAQKKQPSTQRFIADWNYVHEAEKNKNFTETYKKARKLYRQAKSETFKETGRPSLRSYETSKPDIDTKIELSRDRDPIREEYIAINLDKDTGQPKTQFDRKKRRLVKERRAPETMAKQKKLEEFYRKSGRLPEYLEMLQNQYEPATYDVSAGRRSTEFDRRHLAPSIERIRKEIQTQNEELSNVYNKGGVVKRKTKRKKKPKVTNKTYSRGSRKAKYNG